MQLTLKNLTFAIASAGMLTISGCGGSDSASDANLTSVAKSLGGGSSCSVSTGDERWYSGKSGYRSDGQCWPQVQAAESYRTAAIASCAAGNSAAATTYMSYYNKSVTYVNQICR